MNFETFHGPGHLVFKQSWEHVEALNKFKLGIYHTLLSMENPGGR